MAFVVREVDLDRELPLFARIFNENFAIKGSDARFRWLYTDNPDGRATAWFVIDDRSGEVVGGTSVFPRRFRVAGSRTSVVAWNCGDFCIAPRFRSLGAAVKLRQAARDSIEAGASPFLYAHPNDRMLQIHLRVGHQPLGRMVRYARLLRPRTSSRIADAIGGAVLRVADPAVWRRSWQDAGVEPATSLNGDVTGLYEEIGPRLGTSLVRDAAYLRWRFFGSPEGRHELVTTRAAGRLKGWLVFAMEGDVAVIRDWLALDTDSTDALFAAGVAEVRRRGARSVSVIALETHPDLPRLARFGFLRRPDSYTAVTYAASSWTQRSRVLDARHWYMTVGDRDI